MAHIKKVDGTFGIYNEAGFQVEGSFSPNLNGLNPKELLEASIAMCLTIVIEKIFVRDGIEYMDDEFSVEVTSEKAPDSPSRFEKYTVNITLPNHLTDAYKKKVLVSAERGCTISNTIKRGAIVEINS